MDDRELNSIQANGNVRPMIGVFAAIDDERSSTVQNDYMRAIEEAGGMPILLPYVTQNETLIQFVEICDGFLFTGGMDIDPERYGEKRKETCGDNQIYRDELEFKVFQKAIASKKPIIAICRGMQLVNVALGGNLYQDIPSELNTTILHRQSEPKNAPSHAINVLEHTPLSLLMGKKTRIVANSFHHQAIKKIGDGLVVMATADDGVIEAIYLQAEQYLRAYQWHPERLIDVDGDNRLVFTDFMQACLSWRDSSVSSCI